jgi:ADP-heptose:LPS heptosyltransferase
VSAVAVGRALAVHAGALGDVLLAIPALRALRATHGGVALAARPHIAELLEALGEVDAVHDVDSLRLGALFAGDGRAAALPEADRVVCWLGARDAGFIARLRAQAPGAIVAASVGSGPVWEHLLATCGAPTGQWRGVARVDAPLVAAGRAALAAAGWDGRRRPIVVQPGAGGVSKRWPIDGFVAALGGLAAGGDVAIVVHEGPADADAVNALTARMPSALRLREPMLPVLAGVLREAAVYLGNDCGVSHLAAAVGTPAVVVFAAANIAWRPWAREPEVITAGMAAVSSAEVALVRDAVRRKLG